MWKLEKVKARNICAFEELDYTIGQGHTTLIFGNNMDNDSQPSNGSGKSALIEAISIGLTGDVLRDIKSAEEIINDAADEAEIIITLLDEERIFTIERHLFRKSAQTIKLTMNELGEEIELPCSSVAEYNKEVLRQIGLTKDEIFSNIILSKHKYKSFLSSSDKDKKEIINRFSNGIVVDEAIEALHADIEPVAKELTEAQMLVSEKTGQVNVLSEQINEFKQTSLSNKQTKEEKIESNKKLIAEQRALIRQKESEIGELNSQYDRLDDVDDECQRLDKDQDLDMSQCYKSIVSKFAEYNKKCSEGSQLHLGNDYLKKADDYKKELKDTAKFSREIEKSLKAEESSLKKEQANYAKLKTKYDKFMETYGTKSEKIQAKINDIDANIKSVEDSIKSLRSQKQNLEKDVATLNAQLAGVIVCPKCKHEFTLSDDVDIDGVRKKLQDRQGEIKDIDNTISDNYKTLDTCDSDKSSQRALSDKLTSEKSQLFAGTSITL
jgi:DNA repair protein SbcC/Rad50